MVDSVSRRDEFSGVPIATKKVGANHFQYTILADNNGYPVISPGTSVSALTTNEAVTVTGSAADKIAANSSRQACFFFNLSTSLTVYYNFGGTADANGLYLLPGQWADTQIGRGGILYTGAVNMFVASGTASVWVCEA